MLNEEETKKFGGIIYLDTSKPPEAPDKKYIILDLLVQLENGELVHLEIQKYRQSHLPQRATYCWARLYIKDLKSGISYEDLKPVHSLILTTFNVFGNKGNGFVHTRNSLTLFEQACSILERGQGRNSLALGELNNARYILDCIEAQ